MSIAFDSLDKIGALEESVHLKNDEPQFTPPNGLIRIAMTRRTASFSQSDVARAIRAAEQAGGRRWAVEIEGGVIRIVPFEGKPKTKPKPGFDMPAFV